MRALPHQVVVVVCYTVHDIWQIGAARRDEHMDRCSKNNPFVLSLHSPTLVCSIEHVFCCYLSEPFPSLFYFTSTRR